MAFFAVFGLILGFALWRNRPRASTYLVICVAASLATAWELYKS